MSWGFLGLGGRVEWGFSATDLLGVSQDLHSCTVSLEFRVVGVGIFHYTISL